MTEHNDSLRSDYVMVECPHCEGFGYGINHTDGTFSVPGDEPCRVCNGAGRVPKDPCPGGAEYGRGLSRTVVHAGGCCQRWATTNSDQREAIAPGDERYYR